MLASAALKLLYPPGFIREGQFQQHQQQIETSATAIMERHKSLPITSLLDVWLRNEGLETPLLQHRLIKGWPEVMGATVAQYTGEIKIFGNVLRVQIKSPALRQNLLMMRTEIARKMNDFVKAQVIQEVTFY